MTQFLHMISELSAVFISKNCLRELGILSKSFPLLEYKVPKHMGDTPHAMGAVTHTTPDVPAGAAGPSLALGGVTLAPCGCPTRTVAPDPQSPQQEPRTRTSLGSESSWSTTTPASR